MVLASSPLRVVKPESGFEQFWSAYVRRERKQEARDWFRWAMQNHNADGKLLDRMLVTLEWQRRAQPDPRYWQMPHRWLSGMRWEDEPPVVVTVTTYDPEIEKFLKGGA